MSLLPQIVLPFESAILACPMCMSGASGKELMAANTAILIMLAFLFLVLGSFIAFIVYLAKRTRRLGSSGASATPTSH